MHESKESMSQKEIEGRLGKILTIEFTLNHPFKAEAGPQLQDFLEECAERFLLAFPEAKEAWAQTLLPGPVLYQTQRLKRG